MAGSKQVTADGGRSSADLSTVRWTSGLIGVKAKEYKGIERKVS